MSTKPFLKNAARCGTLVVRNELKFARLVQKRLMSCGGGGGGAAHLKGLVVGVYLKEGDADLKLTTGGEKFNEQTKGKLMKLINDTDINGALGKGKVFNNIDTTYRSVAIVGAGREGAAFNELEMMDQGMENVRVATGVGAKSLQHQGCGVVSVDAMDYPEQAAEGSTLAIYRYEENLPKHARMVIPKLDAYASSDIDAWTRGVFKADAQNLARRLSDVPANQMTPTAFSQATVEALCPCGVTVEIRTMDWIEHHRLNSFLMIAKGSCEPPIMLEITYCGTDPHDKPIVLLGKGITFNSGGIMLRPCKGMDEYRGSMAGAAVVVAALRGAAAMSLPINISAVIPLCENLPSGMSARPGDVVTLLNHKSLAVRDLDKAGVVVMADPMIYAQNRFNPRLLVDVATLGMGVVKAFGGGATGIFSNSHYIWKQFQRAGSLTGDRVWRLPLWRFFKKLVTNNVSYDVVNDGSGPATSCLAAAVLHEFVPCVDWAHLDIRGVGMLTKYGAIPYLTAGRMTGRPTRTLIQFLYQMACPEAKRPDVCF